MKFCRAQPEPRYPSPGHPILTHSCACASRRDADFFPPLNGASQQHPATSVDFSSFLPISGLTTPDRRNTYPYSENYFLSVERQLFAGTLLRLSDALGVGLPKLVEQRPATPVRVTRRGEGAVLWRSRRGGRGVLVAGTESPDV